MDNFDPSLALYSPTDVANIGIERIRFLHENRHRTIPIHVEAMQDYFAPLAPGQLCAVIAQTSNYKSGFMDSWAEFLAKRFANAENDEIVIKVDVETLVDEHAITHYARYSGIELADLSRGNVDNFDSVNKAWLKVASEDVHYIGGSIARADQIETLPLSRIKETIRYARDTAYGRKMKIVAIFVDYLQALPIDKHTKRSDVTNARRLQVRDDIYQLRNIAAVFDCPVVVGVQAKQKLNEGYGKSIKLPSVYDGEESSAIAQRADRIITLWMPKQSETLGDEIHFSGRSLIVDDNHLFVKVAKQRGGLPAGRFWPCAINYENRTIHEIQFEEINL